MDSAGALNVKIDGLEKRVCYVEKKVGKLEEHDKEEVKARITDKFELKELITDAVKEGINPLYDKLTQIEERVAKLENKDKEDAYLILKDSKQFKKDKMRQIITVVISVIVTFLITILITHIWDGIKAPYEKPNIVEKR